MEEPQNSTLINDLDSAERQAYKKQFIFITFGQLYALYSFHFHSSWGYINDIHINNPRLYPLPDKLKNLQFPVQYVPAKRELAYRELWTNKNAWIGHEDTAVGICEYPPFENNIIPGDLRQCKHNTEDSESDSDDSENECDSNCSSQLSYDEPYYWKYIYETTPGKYTAQSNELCVKVQHMISYDHWKKYNYPVEFVKMHRVFWDTYWKNMPK